MEARRRQMLQDRNLYPDLNAQRDRDNAISIASNSSSGSSVAALPRTKPRRAVVISDDEDDDVIEIQPPKAMHSKPSVPLQPRANVPDNSAPAFPVPQPYNPRHETAPSFPIPKPLQQVAANAQRPAQQLAGKPIHVPSNRDLQSKPPSGPYVPPIEDGPGERIDVPDFQDDYQYMNAADAEKALRELVGGAINDDAEVEIDDEDAIVDGFKDGIKLMPHQVLGRAWMRDREDPKTKKFGGILADDMGLGKTIQTLARIVEGPARKSDQREGWSATTLVICPLALIRQWSQEIEKMAKGIKVVEHHGPSRTADPMKLRVAQVVVTTYDVVKSEYAVHVDGGKDESKPKAKKKSTTASSDEESDEAEHFGRTLANKKPAAKKGAKKDVLFQIPWFRIVLDEAHNIKNHKTKGAVACCALEAKYRWCLTGTPMQNNVTELYSLLNFLRIKPLNDLSRFNEMIAKPVQSGRGATRAMKRLQVVLKQIMLRRQKDQILNGKKLIELPERNVNIVQCSFTPAEKSFYEALENKMETVMDKLLGQSEQIGKQYMAVLLLLLRLRQACNHPILVQKDYKADAAAVDPKAAKSATDPGDDADDLVAAFGQLGVTKKCQLCQTELHRNNISDDDPTHCSDCASIAMKAKLEADDDSVDGLPSSAKIRKLLELLEEIEERGGGEEKTIIFSQFTSMLDLIQPFLTERGIRFVRYDGSMSRDEREAALEKIRTSQRTKCILISFKAGSTGLNLTACNNVILVDLWWNPALEDQAFDRAHRVGQKRNVHIHKLMIPETVEERILELQDKKRELAKAALSGDKIKNLKLGMDDLMALFRHGRDDDDEDD